MGRVLCSSAECPEPNPVAANSNCDVASNEEDELCGIACEAIVVQSIGQPASRTADARRDSRVDTVSPVSKYLPHSTGVSVDDCL